MHPLVKKFRARTAVDIPKTAAAVLDLAKHRARWCDVEPEFLCDVPPALYVHETRPRDYLALLAEIMEQAVQPTMCPLCGEPLKEGDALCVWGLRPSHWDCRVKPRAITTPDTAREAAATPKGPTAEALSCVTMTHLGSMLVGMQEASSCEYAAFGGDAAMQRIKDEMVTRHAVTLAGTIPAQEGS